LSIAKRIARLRSTHRIISSKTVYKGKVITVKVDRVIEPGAIEATREVVCHPGSVVVLAHLPDRRLLLVRQFRYAVGQPLWELVAGGLESGETPRVAARRELLEETGYRARTLTPLFDFFPSPGILNERMHLVEARGLTFSKAQPEADERIRAGRFTLRQLREMLRAKKITDGKTLVGLYWILDQSPPG
jgi:ADP-ribose pyrophosphatase